MKALCVVPLVILGLLLMEVQAAAAADHQIIGSTSTLIANRVRTEFTVQVGDNPLNKDEATLLEIESTSKGFLPSRMTTAQRDAQPAWKQGHVIYNITEDCLQSYNGTEWECLTDDQVIDTFYIAGDTLFISLENDSENPKTIDLSSYLDDISIYNDNGTLSADRTVATGGNTLNISQGLNVTTFNPSGTDLTITSTDTADVSISSDSGTLDIFVTPGAGGDAIIESALGTNDLIIRNADTTSGSDLMLGTSNEIKFTIYTTGQLHLEEYGLGAYDDTSPARLLSVQADGDIVETPLTAVGTDNQGIDSLSIVNDSLLISLDNNADISRLDLSSYLDNTDNQQLSLVANELILTNDASNVNLSAYLDNTDDQAIDTLSFSSGILSISLEDDAQAAMTVDISGVDTDDQGIDSLSIVNDSLLISLEDNVLISRVDLSAYLDNTDDQNAAEVTVNTSAFDQNLSAADSTVQLALNTLDELVGGAALDSSIYNSDGTLQGNRTVTLGGNSLTFDGATTGDVIIESDGDVGIGTTTPAARLEVAGGAVRLSAYDSSVTTFVDTLAVYMLGTDGEGDVVQMNTAKNSRWFYAPAVTIDASATATGQTIDLHQEYVNQFTAPLVKSPGSPSQIPYYQQDELYYMITNYDNSVLGNVSVDAAGVMTYDIVSVPFDNYTVITVVFLIK